MSQTSSVESMMFPKKGLTAALDTRISIPPHCSRVYFKHRIRLIMRFCVQLFTDGLIIMGMQPKHV